MEIALTLASLGSFFALVLTWAALPTSAAKGTATIEQLQPQPTSQAA